MTEKETLIGWARAISIGKYREAIALLNRQQSQTPESKTPLFRQLQCLLPLTTAWSSVESDSCNGKEKQIPCRPARLCSFCGLLEDENRKIIAGPKVFICESCAKNCAYGFSLMK